MKVLSINTGITQSIQTESRCIQTAIFKSPKPGRCKVGPHGLEGDEQADRMVHGGIDQAVYAFPIEHYTFYARLLRRDDFTYGQFGENFTIDGFLEDQVFIGDRLKIGEVIFEVSQPRTPCSKLGLRLNDNRIIPVMINTLKTGFYLRVIESGEVETGDVIEHFRTTGPCMTVSEIAALKLIDKNDFNGARRASRIASLSPEWKEEFSNRAHRSLIK